MRQDQRSRDRRQGAQSKEIDTKATAGECTACAGFRDKTLLALTAQRYRIRRRISQLRFLNSALLHPVCEVGRRRIVALRDELLGGPVGEQRLDFRTVLVQLAFAGAFWPSDRQAGSPSRAKGFFRPRGDQPRSISAAIFPPKSRSKSSPKIGRH